MCWAKRKNTLRSKCKIKEMLFKDKGKSFNHIRMHN